MTLRKEEKPVKKIMMVNWKWKQFQSTKLNDDTLVGYKAQNLKTEIKKGQGVFFDIYPVADSKKTKDAVFVAVSIYQGQKTMEILLALIDYLAVKYNDFQIEIYLGLHRGNFYTHNDVKTILETKSTIKNCFLFAAGRDYIYYDFQDRGLLDDTGQFRKGQNRKTKEAIITYKCIDKENSNKKTKQIQQPYFDYVWDYYQFEFRKKIFALKQELFAAVGHFTLPTMGESIQKIDLIHAIKGVDNLLYIRLKSFIGIYDQLKTHGIPLAEDEDEDEEMSFDEYETLIDEKEALEALEKKNHISYTLDDCGENLEHINETINDDDKASAFYHQLKDKLKSIILEDIEETTITKDDIREVRHLFGQLVQVLPGSET